MLLGQVVIGPPGAGKSTYCLHMSNFLKKIGRKVLVVNLDPANDQLPYQPDLCITELVRIDEAMEMMKLGPNGALMYAMEFLDENFDWLQIFFQITKGPAETFYFV